MTEIRDSNIPAFDENANDRFRIMEMTMYLMGAISLLASYLTIQMGRGLSFHEAMLSTGWDSILYALPILLVMLFHMIFGRFPLEMLRQHIKNRRIISTSASKTIKETDSLELYSNFTKRSAIVADRLFTRAGAYLLVGGFIAVGAAVAFYVQTSEITKSTDVTSTKMLVDLAPRASLLVFIELVAFYFLRQYRIAMDEYRYYEEIQRKREDVLTNLKNLSVSGSQQDILNFINDGRISSSIETLKDGETTAVLESKKLEKNELDIFKGIIEAVGNARK